MTILKTTKELNSWFIENSNGLVKNVGFVPTMGALHSGHGTLIERASKECDSVVVSVFVNPTQFNETTDFQSYPRTLEGDMLLAKDAGATVVFAPSPEDIYGLNVHAERVDYGPVTSTFEGRSRPGHFDGVISVVDKLFVAVKPQKAYFGSKDLQQVAVVERMSRERHPQIQIVSCDLIRDENGLALSSRNARLSSHGIALAQHISSELQASVSRVKKGLETAKSVEMAQYNLEKLGGLDLEYIGGVDKKTFAKSSADRGWTHIVVAARVEGVRLIDNIEL